jgi:hypothetical protein
MYLNLREITQRGIPARTVLNLRRAGELRAIKFGDKRQSRVRFDADELQRALDARTARADADAAEVELAAAEIEHRRFAARRERTAAIARFQDLLHRSADQNLTAEQRLAAGDEAEKLRQKFRL